MTGLEFDNGPCVRFLRREITVNPDADARDNSLT